VDEGQFAAVLREEYRAIRAVGLGKMGAGVPALAMRRPLPGRSGPPVPPPSRALGLNLRAAAIRPPPTHPPPPPQACTGLEAGYQPRITFVVVQKRHATRLFPTDRSATDRSGNTVPGTVVDTGVCSAAGFDFFLNSHAGLQGHNKASHYQARRPQGGRGRGEGGSAEELGARKVGRAAGGGGRGGLQAVARGRALAAYPKRPLPAAPTPRRLSCGAAGAGGRERLQRRRVRAAAVLHRVELGVGCPLFVPRARAPHSAACLLMRLPSWVKDRAAASPLPPQSPPAPPPLPLPTSPGSSC
jgi:hypothetical protein